MVPYNYNTNRYIKEHNAIMEITALAPAITVTNKQIIILLNFIILLELFILY